MISEKGFLGLRNVCQFGALSYSYQKLKFIGEQFIEINNSVVRNHKNDDMK